MGVHVVQLQYINNKPLIHDVYTNVMRQLKRRHQTRKIILTTTRL
mgnify:CR=1 FL=1